MMLPIFNATKSIRQSATMIPTLAKPEEDDQLDVICLIISMTIIRLAFSTESTHQINKEA